MSAAFLALLLACAARADPGGARRMLESDLQSLGASAAWPAAPAVAAAPDAADDASYRFQKDGTVTECKTAPGPVRWQYCVTTTLGSANRTVLYYLHGHDNGPASWMGSDYKKKVRKAWKAAGFQPPIVVTVSFGGFWLLVDKNASRRSGLLPFFVSDVMPAVEKDLGFTTPPKRLLLGQSMGGFNAIELLLKYPALFSRAALVSPAVAHLSPYASQAELAAYKAQPGASGFKVWMMIRLARKVFKSQADFLRSDPFTLGQTELGPGTPPLLVSAGERDSFGLYRSADDFVALARSRGVSVSYDAIAGGGHPAADANHIASFLAK